ncbi:MAG TPA: hypothetical protein VNH12_01790 [Burkholderiales bacterium]|nr:hypothetical protein [Burkholderiales bacterium]
MASWKMRVDVARNRLYGELEGFFTAEEMKKCADDTIAATKKLRPGYCTITDISRCKPLPPEAAKEIERVQAHFRSSGARQGVRITGSTVLSGMQFKRTGGEAEWNSVNLPSLEEAEKFLDDLK